MKFLKVVIRLTAWAIILLSGIVMPFVLYQLYAVTLGGAVEGEIIYLDSVAPAKMRAAAEFVVTIGVLVFGLALEHYGTKAMDKRIKIKSSVTI